MLILCPWLVLTVTAPGVYRKYTAVYSVEFGMPSVKCKVECKVWEWGVGIVEWEV